MFRASKLLMKLKEAGGDEAVAITGISANRAVCGFVAVEPQLQDPAMPGFDPEGLEFRQPEMNPGMP